MAAKWIQPVFMDWILLTMSALELHALFSPWKASQASSEYMHTLLFAPTQRTHTMQGLSPFYFLLHSVVCDRIYTFLDSLPLSSNVDFFGTFDHLHQFHPLHSPQLTPRLATTNFFSISMSSWFLFLPLF